MFNDFYRAVPFLQIILLICGQFAVILYAATFSVFIKRKCKAQKLILTSVALFLSVVIYIIMQMDSSVTKVEKILELEIPCIILFVFILGLIVFALWMLLSETRNRKKLNYNSIKESFDTLPSGVCFFNLEGISVLCNIAMHRFSFAVSGRDVQYINDIEMCLDEGYVPEENTRREGKIFILPDGEAWQLDKYFLTYKNGETYVQYIATNVTELRNKKEELIAENDRLRMVHSNLQLLSANVLTITREEEILNTKMRVHDEMGKCIVAAQRYLMENEGADIPKSITDSWQRAVSMLKYNNDTVDEDMLLQIRKTCESIKVSFIQNGELPKNENAAYILTCAVRECVTNAVRYAEAKKLYATFSETDKSATVVVTNDGKQPEKEIVEGGGLSTLRRRVEREGGRMYIQSTPVFELHVTVPKWQEGFI